MVHVPMTHKMRRHCGNASLPAPAAFVFSSAPTYGPGILLGPWKICTVSRCSQARISSGTRTQGLPRLQSGPRLQGGLTSVHWALGARGTKGCVWRKETQEARTAVGVKSKAERVREEVRLELQGVGRNCGPTLLPAEYSQCIWFTKKARSTTA